MKGQLSDVVLETMNLDILSNSDTPNWRRSKWWLYGRRGRLVLSEGHVNNYFIAFVPSRHVFFCCPHYFSTISGQMLQALKASKLQVQAQASGLGASGAGCVRQLNQIQ